MDEAEEFRVLFAVKERKPTGTAVGFEAFVLVVLLTVARIHSGNQHGRGEINIIAFFLVFLIGICGRFVFVLFAHEIQRGYFFDHAEILIGRVIQPIAVCPYSVWVSRKAAVGIFNAEKAQHAEKRGLVGHEVGPDVILLAPAHLGVVVVIFQPALTAEEIGCQRGQFDSDIFFAHCSLTPFPALRS